MSLYLLADKIKSTIILSLILSLTACSSHRFLYYVPTPNIPVLEKKGESKLSAEGSLGSQGKATIYGLAFKTAYAISNHWAIGYSYNYMSDHTIYYRSNGGLFKPVEYNYYDSSNVHTSRSTQEFMLGYYTPVNKTKTIFFSTYAGYSIGQFSMNESGFSSDTNKYERHQNGSINTFFIQPGFYINPIPNISLALVGKISAFNYQFADNNYTTNEKDYFKMNVNSNDYLVTFEPTAMISLGVKNFHLIGTATLSSFVSRKKVDALTNCISAGLTVDVVNLLKNK